jgi:serine/threonine protein kinase/Tol biopolymer transport system component
MGEVYRAKDARLGREVAVKVLPESLARNPEALARFQREAQAVAALSHPNILSIFDTGIQDGVAYSVTEMLEGEDLRSRMGGQALPLRKAVDFGAQIARGLAAAHEKGVVHRDIKPENIFVTRDGRVKILDFGLAKVDQETAPAAESEAPTAMPATQPGTVMGTVGYMSPEQVRGKPVDHRTDIFSLGAVLYEMLSGRRAFKGDSAVETMTAILKEDPPDLQDTGVSFPPSLDRIVRHCLEKSPEERFQSAGDIAFNLEALSSVASGSAMSLPAVGGTRSWPRIALTGAAAVALLALGALLHGVLRGGSGVSPAHPETRLSIVVPDDVQMANFELSPDGKTLVVRGRPKNSGSGTPPRVRLYVRRMGSFDMTSLAGTEGARSFTFSPDGRWIAFVAPPSPDTVKNRLAKVPLTGDVPPVTIGTWNDGWQLGAWLPDGDILVTAAGGTRFLRLSSKGGPPGKPFEPETGAFSGTFHYPRPLPGAKAVLMNAISYSQRGFQVSVAAMDLATRKITILVNDGGNAVYAKGGYLVFTRGDTLLAAPFDPGRLAPVSGAVALTAGLRTPNSWAPAPFSLGLDGTLVYAPGGVAGLHRTVDLLHPDGTVKPWSGEKRSYNGQLSVSADGKQMAVLVTNAESLDEMWSAAVKAPVLRPLVAVPKADVGIPVWSPDDRLIAYYQQSGTDTDGIYIARYDGTGRPRLILKKPSAEVTVMPAAWSPDGRFLLCYRLDHGKSTILELPVNEKGIPSGEPKQLLPGSFTEALPAFSPDGRWLAYCTTQSGRWEVYVSAFRNGVLAGAPSPVSTSGGYRPMWSADGRRLAYLELDNRIVFAEVSAGAGFSVRGTTDGPDTEKAGVANQGQGLAWLPDGDFLFVKRDAAEGEVFRLNVVLDWPEELAATMRASSH